jgi:nitroreductase
MGAALQRFRNLMAPKIKAAPQGGSSEYAVYPPNLKEPYRTRRFQVGESMFGLIGIRREDKAARIEQFAHNYDFFGAPVGLFFLVDRLMGAPQWSDIGMYMQNIMLLARERGLETCPQEAWSAWHREVSEFLGSGPELMLFCGMALGYGDYAAPINRLRAERATVDEFATLRVDS